MQSLTPNQRRYLTVLTLLTVAFVAYLVALVPGAASANEPAAPAPTHLVVHLDGPTAP